METERDVAATAGETRPARLSAIDMINLAVEARATPMAIGSVLVVDGGALGDVDGRLTAVRAAIDRRLADVAPLRRIVHRPGPLAGRPVWVDDPDFRIDRHVLAAVVPPPGDEPTMLRLVADLMAPVLDHAHPLWRIWVITGLAGGRVALLVKMHHVIADGAAAIGLIGRLLDAPIEGGPATTRAWQPAPVPAWRELAADNARATLAAMRPLARRVNARRLTATLRGHRRVLAEGRGAPRTSLNAPVGPSRRLAVLRLDLATARSVAHRRGGTVNDLVLSLAAAGLRALLQSRGEPVDGLRLRCTVAVSLRQPGRSAGEGNRTGGFVVRLPCGQPDSGRRLSLIAAETARAKRDQPATVGNALLVWLARLGLVRWFARRQRLTNVLESNVVGPTAPIRVLGTPVLDVIPIGNLAGNLGISFLALSYAGRLNITVQADAERFGDLPVLTAAMRRDWAALGGPESPPRCPANGGPLASSTA
jgi:WS/DGAT/MGAT family acyltransferase